MKQLRKESGIRPGGKRPVFYLSVLAMLAAALAAPQLFNLSPAKPGVARASHSPYMSIDQAYYDSIKVNGTVPGSFVPATYLSGGSNTSGSSPINDWGETVDGTFDPSAANNLDHRWIQTVDNSPVVYDLGSPSTSVYIFPSIDHAPVEPVPYEALEFTVWGSNNPNAPFPAGWTLANLSAVYTEGWVNAGSEKESDDFVSLWTFNGTFRYLAVFAGRSIEIKPDPWPPGSNNPDVCAGEGVFCSRDAEIDAVSRVTSGLPLTPPIQAGLDVHPTSCPNPLNANGNGIYPAAILGSSTFDVNCIDVSTIRLEGVVVPSRINYVDVAAPFNPLTGKTGKLDCTTAGPDGFTDLTLKFDKNDLVAALGPVTDGQVRVVHLTANLKAACGGNAIVGEDVVVIIKKK